MYRHTNIDESVFQSVLRMAAIMKHDVTLQTERQKEKGERDKYPSSKLPCHFTVFLTALSGVDRDSKMVSDWRLFFALSSWACVSAPLMCYRLNAKMSRLFLCQQSRSISSSSPNDELCFSWQHERFLFSTPVFSFRTSQQSFSDQLIKGFGSFFILK